MSIEIRRAIINDADTVALLLDAYRIFYKQTSDIEAAKTFIKERLEKKMNQ